MVTGGTKRVGLAISDVLRMKGFEVIATTRDGGEFPDFTEPDATEKVVRILRGRHIYGLVNNASVFSPALTLPPEEALRIYRVNKMFPERLAEELRPQCVVNILDCRILKPGFSPRSPYEQSKADLLAATLRQAVELAPRTRVNAVAPGPVLASALVHEKAGATLLGRIPAPRDVGEAVAYLLAGESITGQVLAIDAGQSLMP